MVVPIEFGQPPDWKQAKVNNEGIKTEVENNRPCIHIDGEEYECRVGRLQIIQGRGNNNYPDNE